MANEFLQRLAPITVISPESVDATRAPQRLAGTGTTEASNSTALQMGKKGTLLVGAGTVRIVFRSAGGVAASVATTSPLIPAGALVEWDVDSFTKHVYCEAGDGSSAYEAWVWTSSP